MLFLFSIPSFPLIRIHRISRNQKNGIVHEETIVLQQRAPGASDVYLFFES